MDRLTLTPRRRALLALGACSVLLTATIGSAAARADLREPGDVASNVVAPRDDEREQELSLAAETDEPETEAPETSESQETAEPKDAAETPKPDKAAPKKTSTSEADEDDQGED